MALTPQEQTYISTLQKEGKNKQEMAELLKQRRENPDRLKSAALGFTRELAGVGMLAGQVSRLAPGDQSADPSSFFNRYKESYGQVFGDEGIAVQKGMKPESGYATAGGFASALVPMGASTKLAQLGLKGLGTVAPKIASKAAPFVSLASKPTLSNVAKFGAVEGAKDTAIYDTITKGETTPGSVALGGLAGLIGGPALFGASKLLGGIAKQGAKINTSKVGAYVEQGADIAKRAFSGLQDTAGAIKSQVGRIPSNIKTNVAAQKATQEVINKLPTQIAKTAVMDGVDIADAQMLPKVIKNIKPQAKQLLKTIREFENNPRGTNPIEVVGRPITKKLQQLEKTRQVIGRQLGEIADKSLGKVSKQEAVPMVFRELKKVQGLNGLKLDKKLQLDFADTVLATKATAADRKAIQSIFNDAINTGTGKSKHLLRQELFEILDGKKKSLQTLTGTQEKAYDAIRKGLSDILEGKNPQYKAVSNEYRKVIQPLSEMRKFMKSLPDATEDILDMKGGLLARRLTSNAVSNPQVRQLLRNLDKVTGGKTTESVEAMQDLYNILDKYYNIAGKTGFKGQVQSGIEGSVKGTIGEAVKGFAGQSEAVVKKAINDLMEDLLR